MPKGTDPIQCFRARAKNAVIKSEEANSAHKQMVLTSIALDRYLTFLILMPISTVCCDSGQNKHGCCFLSQPFLTHKNTHHDSYRRDSLASTREHT